MRIAFITYEFPPETGKGGIGTYTKQVASILAGLGWDIHVFSGTHQKKATQKKDGYQVHLIECDNGFDFREKVVPVFSTEHYLRPFDLIESAEINGNAWEVKKAFPLIPMVVRLHAPNWLVENLKKRYIPFVGKLRFLLGALRRGKWDAGYWRSYDFKNDSDYQFTLLANAVTAPSQVMKKWAVEHWKLTSNKIILLANPFVAPETLLQLPILYHTIHKEIVFFGRLNVLKGLVNATMAMKQILKEFPAYQFKVIGNDGEGPTHKTGMRQWMQQQLKEVKGKVIFENGLPYEQLPAAIAEAEIVLLPSLFESFSYTCAEAMAAGKAVVGSKNTGMVDMIEHGKNGLLVDAENGSEIYTALKQLILDNDGRYRMAVQARQSIQLKYNAQKLVEQYLDFYKTVAFAN